MRIVNVVEAMMEVGGKVVVAAGVARQLIHHHTI